MESEKNVCNDKSFLPNNPILDKPPGNCDVPELNLKNPNTEDLSWLNDKSFKKTGLGAGANCDPMQTGQIVQDSNDPDTQTVYRYSKAKRGCDEAMIDLFRNVIVIDENAKAFPVPIIWGTQEKAVAAILQENLVKDETLVVNRIRLPFMAIVDSGYAFNTNRYVYHKAIDYMRDPALGNKPGFTTSEKYERDTIFGVARGIPIDINYTLTIWTLYLEDMNQIFEQIITKFSQTAYIRVTGVPWEVIVKLDSISNNLDAEPGDQAIRIIKYEFGFTTETFIPQPIVRKKAILKTKIDIVDGLNENEISKVMLKIEEAVKELKC